MTLSFINKVLKGYNRNAFPGSFINDANGLSISVCFFLNSILFVITAPKKKH